LLDVIGADPEAPAHNQYFDGVIYHLYFNPTQTADVLEETKATLRGHHIAGKELWINETNAPPSDDPLERPWSKPRFRVSLQEQAAFMIQEFALAFSSGASRVEVYKLRNTADHPESIEPFGLLRADDSRRPAFVAYQVATSYLRDFRRAYRQRSGSVVAVTFDRGAQTTTVLWTTGRNAARAAVRAIASEARLIDERGHVSKLRAANGVYVVDLPAPTGCGGPSACMIGGAPRLLLETGPSKDRQALLR
jgi:hypothetical protein